MTRRITSATNSSWCRQTNCRHAAADKKGISFSLSPSNADRLALKFRFVVGWMEGRPNQAKSTPRLNERQRMRTVSPLTKFLPTDLCDLNSHVSLSHPLSLPLLVANLSEEEISGKRKKKKRLSRCTKEFSPFPFSLSLLCYPNFSNDAVVIVVVSSDCGGCGGGRVFALSFCIRAERRRTTIRFLMENERKHECRITMRTRPPPP